VSYTSALTISSQIFICFPYTLGAALTRASTCSGRRSRRLGPLSTDGLCIRGQPPPSQGGHRVQFEVRPPFVSRLLYNSPLRLRVRYPSATIYITLLRWDHDGIAIYTPTRRHSFLFHLIALLFTGRRPNRGPSLATVNTDKEP
jgi:hypothetical protein